MHAMSRGGTRDFSKNPQAGGTFDEKLPTRPAREGRASLLGRRRRVRHNGLPHAPVPRGLTTLRSLRDGFVAPEIRVGNARQRDQDGREHQCEDNGTLHLVSLLPSLYLSPLLMVDTRGAFPRGAEKNLISPGADTPVLRVLAEFSCRVPPCVVSPS